MSHQETLAGSQSRMHKGGILAGHSPSWTLSSRRFRALLVKEFRHILRDTRTLLLVTLAPGFLLLLLANIFAIGVQQSLFALWDLDRSPLSRRYVSTLTADETLLAETNIASEASIDALLRTDTVDFVLIIPHGFGRDLAAGKQARVQAVFDATDGMRVPQQQAQLVARTAIFSKDVLLEGMNVKPPTELQSVIWYNPGLDAMVGMVPGLTPIVLSMPTLAFALSLARERELGSFEGLIATPIRGIEYLLSKALAYISLGILSVLGAWLIAVLWFQVPFRGSFPVYIALAALYLAAMAGMTMMFSPVLKSQQVAFFVILAFFFVPSFFNAGLVVPVLSKGFKRFTSDILPATHFLLISQGIFVKGLGLAQLARPVAILAVMSVSGMVTALLSFRKHL